MYQKLVIFTPLYEILGLGCGSGPLTGRFSPLIGGFLYWLRPNTIRLPPWPERVPLTRGDTRTVVDVALYAVVLISGSWALLAPGGGGPVTADGDGGLVSPALVVPTIVALVLLGLGSTATRSTTCARPGCRRCWPTSAGPPRSSWCRRCWCSPPAASRGGGS